MVLQVSISQSFQECLTEMCWVRKGVGLIIYSSKMFKLVENRLFAYVDDSTLLAVIRKPADRPAVAASLSRDLGRMQECCNHFCMILNRNTTRALVIS